MEEEIVIKLVLDSVLFTPDSSSELHVSDHDGNSLSVDGAEVGVLEKSNQIGFGGFLESQDSLRLEPDVVLYVSGDVLDDSLERQLSNEKVSLKLNFNFTVLWYFLISLRATVPGLYLCAFLTPPVTYGGAVFLADFMLVFFFGVLTEADFLVVVFVRAIFMIII